MKVTYNVTFTVKVTGEVSDSALAMLTSGLDEPVKDVLVGKVLGPYIADTNLPERIDARRSAYGILNPQDEWWASGKHGVEVDEVYLITVFANKVIPDPSNAREVVVI